MPELVYSDGRRLPASNANFYTANGLVLVPAFIEPGGPSFTRIVGAGVYRSALGLGALHCTTRQQPSPNTSGLFDVGSDT